VLTGSREHPNPSLVFIPALPVSDVQFCQEGCGPLRKQKGARDAVRGRGEEEKQDGAHVVFVAKKRVRYPAAGREDNLAVRACVAQRIFCIRVN
jgi:hypothetical protein